MKAISVSNLSLGWLTALEYLIESGGTATNLHVEIKDVNEEDMEIRSLLDKFNKYKGLSPVSTVANTIFPVALYYPDNPRLTGSKARHHLYRIYIQGNKVRQRCKIREETQQESGLKCSITEVYSTVSNILWRQRGCYDIWNDQRFTI